MFIFHPILSRRWPLFLLLLTIPAVQNPGAATQPASRPRNPFRPEGSLRAPDRSRGSQGDEFQRLQSVPELPEMRLRGILKMKKKTRPAAMIEVTGVGSYLVHEGDKLGLTLRAP